MAPGRKPKQRPALLSTDDETETQRQRDLGLRVRMARERIGWSLRDLEARSGLHRNELERLENGKVDPRASTIRLLARCLMVEDTWLMSGSAIEAKEL